MKLAESIFCFLCLLLLISSLHHLRLYIRCNNKNNELSDSLTRNMISNQSLVYQINDLNSRVNNLREVSAKKIVANRDRRKSSNQLGKTAALLIQSLRDKQQQHVQLQQEITDELQSQELRRRQKIIEEESKVMKPPIRPIGEQPYLLIEPQH